MNRSLAIALGIVLLGASWPDSAARGADLGVRFGFEDGADDVYVGMEVESGVRVGPAVFAPSADLVIEDENRLELNGDLRWDLLPIPETGIMLYGKAGPTLVFSDDNELGISLTIGGDVPMRKGRSLQLEVRFGFGDLASTKIGAAVMF